MITLDIESSFMTEPNYYRIKFSQMPYELFEYGLTARDAIAEAKAKVYAMGCDTDKDPEPLGNATARLAVYKEWTYGTEHYTNGGEFIKDTSKPCRECGQPVPFHTHKEELGYCQPCQADYFNHECAKCGKENVNNWDGNPFTRYCDECEA